MAKPAILLGTIVFFMMASAFFSASETALFSIPRERITFFQQAQQRPRQWVFRLLKDGQRTLLMILLGNIFVNITLAGLIHTFLTIVLPLNSALMSMALATLVIVVFGEILPKNLALKYNEHVTCFIAPYLMAVTWVCSPLLNTIQKVNNFFLRHFKLILRQPSPFVTVEELKTGVMATHTSGAITSEEQDMIVGLLDKGAEPVRKFMLHRTQLLIVPGTVRVGVVLERLRERKQRFLLVHDLADPARISGVVSLPALLRSELQIPVKECMIQPLWVPESMNIVEVISLLHVQRRSEACLLDEFGSFEGVVTLDEGFRGFLALVFQPTVPKSGYTTERTKIFTGDTVVDTMPGWLPPSLRKKGEEARTLNGLLTNFLGVIPQTGDKFALEACNFYIIAASSTKIESVLIKKRDIYEC